MAPTGEVKAAGAEAAKGSAFHMEIKPPSAVNKETGSEFLVSVVLAIVFASVLTVPAYAAFAFIRLLYQGE